MAPQLDERVKPLISRVLPGINGMRGAKARDIATVSHKI